MNELSRKERERLTRKKDIINAARKIMCLKGFDAASMDEIAKEAQFTKRTLYQYFESKEDLYFAVTFTVFNDIQTYVEDKIDDKKSGYENITEFCYSFYHFFMQNKELLNLIGQIGYVRKKSLSESNTLNSFFELSNSLFSGVADILVKGIKDGSIKASFDPTQTSFGLVFLLIGFFNQLSTTGETFTSNYSINIEEFSRNTLNLILCSLENNVGRIGI